MSTEPPLPRDRLRPLVSGYAFLVACLLFVLHAFLLWRGGPAFVLTQLALAIAVPIAGVAVLAYISRKESGATAVARYAELVLLVVVTLSFLTTPLAPYIVDLGSEHHVKQVSNIERIYAWGLELLKRPVGTLAGRSITEHTYELNKAMIPEYVRRITLPHSMPTIYLIDEGPNRRYIQIPVWQGRPHSYGILLCPVNYIPTSTNGRWIRRWRSGVYGWQDINEIS